MLYIIEGTNVNLANLKCCQKPLVQSDERFKGFDKYNSKCSKKKYSQVKEKMCFSYENHF